MQLGGERFARLDFGASSFRIIQDDIGMEFGDRLKKLVRPSAQAASPRSEAAGWMLSLARSNRPVGGLVLCLGVLLSLGLDLILQHQNGVRVQNDFNNAPKN